MTHNFTAGQIVRNFGQVARIIEVRPAPYNDLILAAHGLDIFSGKWAADPSKCELLSETTEVFQHKTGLVTFA